MYEEINKKLEDLRAGANRYRKLDGMLKRLEEDQKILESKLKTLKEQLDKENRDVERFEGLSVTSMFHKLFGSYDVELDKEKQEAFRAQLKYNTCLAELNDVKSEIESRRYEKIKYKNCSYDLEKTLNQKVEMLKKSDAEESDEVIQYTAKIDSFKAKLKEIDEALDVGDAVLKAIVEVRNSLKSAQGWGVWDMVGGGLISNIAKHSHIDKAKNQSNKVQTLLRQFKNELLDIEITENINIKIEGFDTFIDFFADGIIADYFVQTKIHSAQDSVENVQKQVDQVIDMLYKMKGDEELQLNKYNEKLEKIMCEI